MAVGNEVYTWGNKARGRLGNDDQDADDLLTTETIWLQSVINQQRADQNETPDVSESNFHS